MSKPSGSGRADTPRWKGSGDGGGGAERSWRAARGPSQGSANTPRYKTSRVILWGGLAGALVAALVLILLNLPHPTPVVALIVSDYDDALPPNAYAQEDGELLEALLAPRGVFSRDYRVEVLGQDEQEYGGISGDLIDAINASNKGTVIIYLNAHGIVDEQDRPLLALRQFHPDQPAGRRACLDMANFLQDLKDQVPSETTKILVIDAGRAPFYWQVGFGPNRYENRFADFLRRAVSTTKCPNLHVVISAGPGQVSWPAPELGGSAFGHFLARGLAGEADDDKDGQIMLDELVRHTTSTVAGWVQEYRLAAQLPQYWNSNGESARPPAIKVADASSGESAQIEVDDQTRSFDDFVRDAALRSREDLDQASFETLSELWRGHADLTMVSSTHQLSPLSRHPMKLARLEWLLVRAEQYLFAGKAYQRKLRETLADAERILATLERSPEHPPPYSLPLASQAGEAHEGDEAIIAGLGSRERLAIAELRQAVAGLQPPASMNDPAPVESMFVRMLAAHLPDEADLEAVLPLAVDTRLLAEQMAAPTDVRTARWAEQLLDEASESTRRTQEDQLFAARDGDAPRGLLEAFQSLRDRYNSGTATMEALVDGYRARDDAIAQLPKLAQWHLANLQVGALPSDDSALASQNETVHRSELQRIVPRRNAAQTLSIRLTNPTSDIQEALREIVAATETVNPVSGSVASLQEEYRQWTTAEAIDEEQVRQIWLALQSPLLTGETRERLRERFLQRLAAYNLAPFGSASATEARASVVGEDGDQQQVVERPATSLAEFDAVPDLAFADGSDGVWQAMEEAAYRRRLTATFQSHRDVEDEPIEQLHLANRHRQLVWHAHRAIDDFWGPVDRPYFEQAATQFLARAREIDRELLDTFSDQSVAHEEARLTARIHASNQGIRFAPSSTVTAQRSNPLSIQFPVEGLAQGTGVVSVRDAANEFRLSLQSATARFALDTSGLPRECDLEFNGDLGAQVAHCADLSVLFRGHVWESGQVCLPTGKYHAVAWTKPDYGPARVTVQGQEKQVPYLVYILDCSLSMNEDMGETEGRSRMVTAKSALRQVVRSLARGRYNIGLTLFGRNFASRRNTSGGVQPVDRQNEAATWLQVLTDVEPKFSNQPLGAPGTDTLLERALGDAEPFGITPLYHSLLTTIQKAPIGDDQLMQIVVLTDGDDTQGDYADLVPGFVPTRKGSVEPEIRRLDDRLLLDVIGLDFNGGNTGVADLARQTGGDFHYVTNTEQLEQELADLLRSVQFRVRPAGESGDAAGYPLGAVDLDSTFTVQQPLAPVGRDFIVAMHGVKSPIDARVMLEGGEHLLMQYRRQSLEAASLFHSRYVGTSAVANYPTEPNSLNPLHADVDLSPRECYVTAHNPESDGEGGVVFRVSVQNQSEREFSLRPRHVWAEIRPILLDRRQEEWPIYPFFDVTFEEDKPVPVLMFHIPNWPWGETDAEIRIWFTYKRDLPEQRIPLVIQEADSFTTSLPAVQGLEGVSFAADVTKENNAGRPFQIVVREEHAAGRATSPDAFYASRVQVWPTPSSATHKYYDESNLVRHEFIFEDTSALRTVRPEIRITPSAEIKSPVVSVAIDGRTVGIRKVGPLVVRVPSRW